MDRKIVYTGQVPLGDDFLLAQRYTLTALGMALKAVLGTQTIVDGLACTPTGPASMQVIVGAGSIHSLQSIDGTAYSDLAADTTHQIVKQGLSLDNTTLSCPAPATTGQSINYLIQVAYQDQDTDSVVLPYFNASNPTVAYAGPNNTGVSQNTTRKGKCIISVKAGVSATTGTQTTPAPDAGFIGLWVVTVANGALSITSGNISLYTGASAATGSTAFWSTPFIAEKLNDKVSVATGDLRWQPIGGGGTARTRLSNAANYYVATTGNDTTGTGSIGSPWATIQKAYDYIAANVDLNGFSATIHVADGTYSGGLSATIPTVGGKVTLIGNTTTPANVVLSTGSSPCIAVFNGCSLIVAGGFKCTNTTYMVMARGSGSNIAIQGPMNYGAGGGTLIGHLNAFWGGFIEVTSDYTISGGAGSHVLVGQGTIRLQGVTITLTGTPTFIDAFAAAQSAGTAEIFPVTWSGSGSGQQYKVTLNGVVNTNGGGLPSGLSGNTTSSGGQYV